MTTAQIAGLLASTLLPLVVAYLTKASAPAVVKSLALLALTALTTAATSVASGADLKSSVTTGALAYATAVAAHFGLLKPTGATDAVAAQGNADTPASADDEAQVPDDYEYEGPVEEPAEESEGDGS